MIALVLCKTTDHDPAEFLSRAGGLRCRTPRMSFKARVDNAF
jgi:hypothetical protein